MYQSRLIDLSNYQEKDLKLTGLQGTVLSIITEGNPTVSIKGQSGKLESEIDLAVVSLSDFSKGTSISGEGAYVVPILGIDRIELTVSGSGKIYLKELVG